MFAAWFDHFWGGHGREPPIVTFTRTCHFLGIECERAVQRECDGPVDGYKLVFEAAAVRSPPLGLERGVL